MAEVGLSTGAEVCGRWDDGFVVRRMSQAEGPRVVQWIGDHDRISFEFEISLEVDGSGFFAGELNGEMVSSLVVTPIADDLRFIGYIFVVERHRRRGFARRMMTAARHVERSSNWTGVVTLFVDPGKESIYEKFDYIIDVTMVQYEGVVTANVDRADKCTTQVGLCT